MSGKALVVSPFFATIFATIAAGGLAGGMTYAWNTNADFAVLQRDVKQIKDANLDVRMSVIEQNFRSVSESMIRMETSQSRMNDKLDKLLEERRR
jgi:protein involved in polysaccharide export with SLBB domain